MLGILVTIVHVVVSLFLIGVVLLQTGKRADLAGAFGGGGSQTAFGARGTATVLSKATTIAAVLFMVTSVTLAIHTTQKARGSGTVLNEVDTPAATAPATTDDAATDEGTSGGPMPDDGATLPPLDAPVESTDDASPGTSDTSDTTDDAGNTGN